MPHDLPKAYDPTAIEDHWAEYWVREDLFAQPTPDPNEKNQSSSGEPFVILLPPPNVTGSLHMGHMFEHTESDILARWHRMRGDRVLWVPGTDHAGIATQMLVERQVVSEGTTRQQMGREAFVERVWKWREHYGGTILGQMKRLGASVDWQREYFTMDERLSIAVREAFVKLHEQGLIYRGAYIVNWCPRCQTAISDLEVVYDEHKGHLWEIRYPVVGDDGKDTGEFLTVATTRPETMLGDVAVAIHPEDERYTHLHAKMLRLPLTNREIPVILDGWVSRDFGTGAVKVTPAHDPNDFALGQRHNLPSINVMDETAHINAEGGAYAGLDRFVARKKIVEDLEAQGLLAGIKDHTLNIGHCDRCKTIVEPRLSLQWFVKIQPLADKAIAAVKPDADGKKAIRIFPEQYEKVYLEWMANIHDWCISRQLWWGHRIPAWSCAVCHKMTVAREDPTKCAHCGSDKITQETDVLDTWFSSGLLPVSVFGWPNIVSKGTGFSPYIKGWAGGGALAPEGPSRADFDTFYPTNLLVTGFDILFFWVARMIMLGCWFAGDVPMPDGSKRELKESVPFREVYIHALVRDANREKMSKTKGNVVDPIEIVKQYGTDAVRFTLASMASPGTDIAFNIARTEGYRAFANKIWNAARFIFMNVDRAAGDGITVDRAEWGAMPREADDASYADQWIIGALHLAVIEVNRSLAAYRYDDAANTVYKFFWGAFCDSYIEIVKQQLGENTDKDKTRSVLTTLVAVFEAALRLLSPFMPFLTEELWHALYDGNPPAKSIALTQYPKSDRYSNSDGVQSKEVTQAKYAYDPKSHAVEMSIVQSVNTALRAQRKEVGVPEKERIPGRVYFSENGSHAASVLQNTYYKNLCENLTKVELTLLYEPPSRSAKIRSEAGYDVEIVYESTTDIAAERERLTKEIAKYEKGLASAERQLGNDAFLAKAPAHIVEGLKKQEAETRALLEKARAALDALSSK